MSRNEPKNSRLVIAGVTFLALCAISYWLFAHWLLIYVLAGVLLFLPVVMLAGNRSLARSRVFFYAALAAYVGGGLLGYYYPNLISGWLHVA